MSITTLMGRTSIKGWELRQGIESLVAQVCRSRGVKAPVVVWDPSIQTAAVDQNGRRMYLACPADDAVITRPVFTRYVGFVVHEVLHLVYTTSSLDANGNRLPTYVHSLWNAVEDAWIEGRGIADRVTGNINAVLRELIDQMVSESLAAVSDWSDPRQYPFALAVYLRQHATRKVPLAQGLEPIFAEAARRLAASQSSADNVLIAQWVMDQLKQQDNPQTNPDQGQDGEQGQDGDQGQQGQDGAQGDAGQGGEGQDAGQDAGPARAPDEMGDAMEVEPDLGEAGKVCNGTGSTYCPGTLVSRDSAHLDLGGDREDHAKVQPVSGRLRNELRRLFDNSGLSAFQRGRKSGALNTASLHRVGQTDRLFQRRLEQDGVDSAVVILVDRSGSMSEGQRFGRRSAAVSAALAIHDALTLAGCAVTIMSFGDTVSTAVPWGCAPAKAKALLPALWCSGGTNDSFAIRYAHEVLLRRPEERKALMVLTDAGGRQDEVRDQIAVAEGLGISTIGIGIQAKVGHVYPQSVDVYDMDELGRAALSQMKLAA